MASTSLLPTSAPGLASSDEDKDVLDLPPLDRASQATTQVIVDSLPQLLPPPSVTGIATASPSQQEFDAKCA